MPKNQFARVSLQSTLIWVVHVCFLDYSGVFAQLVVFRFNNLLQQDYQYRLIYTHILFIHIRLII